MAALPHPLSALSIEETNIARDVVVESHPGSLLTFRQIFLREPPKTEVVAFLEVEHSGGLAAETPRPQRLSQVLYDVVGPSKVPEYHESVVDLRKNKVVHHEVVSSKFQAGLTMFVLPSPRSHSLLLLSTYYPRFVNITHPHREEFEDLINACKKSPLFQAKLAELQLPEGFDIVIEPWPYGAADPEDGETRFFQGLIFAQDTRNGNPDSNFYPYPLPLIPIMDARKKEIVRIDEPATGGKGDGLREKTHDKGIIDHCKASEYVPELLPGGPRTDLKPLAVVQPDGPSFTVEDGNLVKWQKWSMRLTFNPREGAVLHDVRFDDRNVFYRLSMSEMVRWHLLSHPPMPTVFPSPPLFFTKIIKLSLLNTVDHL